MKVLEYIGNVQRTTYLEGDTFEGGHVCVFQAAKKKLASDKLVELAFLRSLLPSRHTTWTGGLLEVFGCLPIHWVRYSVLVREIERNVGDFKFRAQAESDVTS